MFSSRSVCLGLFIAASGLYSYGQTAVSFTPKTSTDAQTPANLYAVDLNNDGFDDIVGDDGLSAPGFNVSINNGDGTFKAPVHYAISSNIGPQPIVTGDFNNDGKADVAVMISGTNQIAFYAGDGDGSLSGPHMSVLTLPSGWNFGSGGAAAGDFNGDGRVGIAAWTTNFGSTPTPSVTAVYVFEGDGAGGFSNPHLVFQGPGSEPDFQLFVGDFDADGKADILATEYTLDRHGNNQNTHAHVCYGNKDFTFTDTIAYTQALGGLLIGSGDLNSDGISEFYSLNGYEVGGQLGVFFGQTSRTFQSYFQPLHRPILSAPEATAASGIPPKWS